ncbi:MAG: 2-oxoacid:acceptor oxidoreductase subunit alpha, partial [Bacteroidetes bacterium]|nr:2-oxoacid:acceptor oxidoreductase subunit alpha [Bacteroidota bacterium]MBU1720804.1 2-oxoacid:acceptor oxidoreductase subunit alpha [Bacteroidota bacterium]
QKMTDLRQEKVERVANYIPKQEVIGQQSGDLLVVGWGGTWGAIISAVNDLIEQEVNISSTQFNYIMPLPLNTEEVLSKFKRILICENNMGQFAKYLRAQFPHFNYVEFHKVQGLPFMISELKEEILKNLEEIHHG